MRQILFFLAVKKIKNRDSDEGADGIGGEVDPVASAAGDEVFLHQFGEAAVGDADDEGEENGSLLVDYPVGNELFAITPKTEEGEGGIHEKMHHLVEAHHGLDTWKNRTRKPC